MAAHRGDFEDLPVGDSIGLADKAQRVLDAMAFKTRTAGAFLSLIQRSADVNGKSKIGLFEFFDKGHSVVRIVKNRRNRRRARNTIHDTFQISLLFSPPVHRWIQIFGRLKQRSMTRVADIDRVVLSRNLQKSPLLFNGVRIVNTAGRNGEYDEVVVETVGRAIAMQRVCHSCRGGLSFVLRAVALALRAFVLRAVALALRAFVLRALALALRAFVLRAVALALRAFVLRALALALRGPPLGVRRAPLQFT
jgi:hypothetical protein